MERMQTRLERVEQFIKYLEQQEAEEFDHFNLDGSEIRFAKKIRASFNEEKDRVIISAKKNQ